MTSNLERLVAKEVAENVVEFVELSAKKMAELERQRFREEVLLRFIEGDSKSPIEQIFYCAFLVVAAYQYADLNQEPYWNERLKDWDLPSGVYISEQVKIDKYRVDFIVSWKSHSKDQALAPVVVELDGHDFHDKNKKQRSYEKARDRFFTRSGYRVVHFTGSDIVKDPYLAAWEVLEMVSGSSMDEYQRFKGEM